MPPNRSLDAICLADSDAPSPYYAVTPLEHRQLSKADVAASQLEANAHAAKDLLQFASRAFVIEFAGTPKAGKSTSVEAIRHFFSRSGFRVHVLVERASVCPIPMKGHLFFNTWCTSTMLSELLAHIDTETDILIVDRGLFDSLVWLTMQRERGELTQDEANTIESYALLERWRSLFDLTIVMDVSADEAMDRETSQRITQTPGSIMNRDVLARLSSAVDTALKRYEKSFPVYRHTTTGGASVRDSNIKLGEEIVSRLRTFLDQEILVLPAETVRRLDSSLGTKRIGDQGRDAIARLIEQEGRFVLRSLAESDKDLVQVVAAGVLRHRDRVFVFERGERDKKSGLYGKLSIWHGTHVGKAAGEPPSVELVKHALQARLSRKLFLSRVFESRPIGYCWDRELEHSHRHLGLTFVVNID